MRICSACNKELDKSCFYKKTARYLKSECKDCSNQRSMELWKKRKEEAVAYLGGRCLDCKKVFPIEVYDFHHLDPSQKEMNWNKMRLTSDSKRKTELDKCVLLCANCHRIRHINCSSC